MLNEYLKKILSSRVYDVAEETPVHTATFLSERLENQIWIKREDKQPVYSFKIRGAYNKVVQLTDEEKADAKAKKEADKESAKKCEAPGKG